LRITKSKTLVCLSLLSA